MVLYGIKGDVFIDDLGKFVLWGLQIKLFLGIFGQDGFKAA